MPDPHQAHVATFVSPHGTNRARLGAAVGGVVGAAAAGTRRGESSPLAGGKFGYLGVYPNELVLFATKQGAFKPKITDTVLASMPRTAVHSASVERKINGMLEVRFADGTSWQFDIPRQWIKGAREVSSALDPTSA
jgi:hypothetical protein